MDDELEFSIRPTTIGNQLFDQVRNFLNLFACFVGVASSYGAGVAEQLMLCSV